MQHGEAQAALNALGIEGVCAQIYDGIPLRKIATGLGVSQGSLIAWLAADPERSARAREARRATAQMWEEMAEKVIEEATTKIQLARARELAHHYRWRASKIAPAEFGNKVQAEITGAEGGPIKTEAVVNVEAGEAYLRMLHGRT
ncbi:hypothetical protein [Burkholderia gladioli]|uniref:terminase small subunit-like protein n=1 Tax=Burkholderia gladioli TaxID=28095 RepID=UPI0016418A60|nr:hypothetical protein [Burkholderia gladioli]